MATYKRGWDGDFTPLITAASTFLHGGHPFEVGGYVYPPSALLIFAPFGAVSEPVARAAFLVCDAVATFAAVLICARMAGFARRSVVIPLMFVCGVFFAPVGETLHLMNVNGLVVLGECGAFAAAISGRWRISGVLLGATFAVKPVLLPLLLVLVIRREWVAAAWAVAVPVVLSLIALPLVGGAHEFFSITVPFLINGNARDLQQFSTSLVGAGHNWGIPSLIVSACRLAVVLLSGYLVTKRLRRSADDAATLVDVATIILLATFLCFSFSWNYYAIYLMPAFVLITAGRSVVRWTAAVPSLVLLGSPDIWIWHVAAPQLSSLRITVGFIAMLAAYAWSVLRPSPSAATVQTREPAAEFLRA